MLAIYHIISLIDDFILTSQCRITIPQQEKKLTKRVFDLYKGMKTTHISKAEIVKNPHGVKSQKLHTSEHVSLMHLTLQPGEKLRQHITPVDVLFYVLEGKGIVEIGDEKREVSKDTLIDSPKGVMH